jgi:tetratricopeptide (TPR) repeat protein
MKFQRLWSLLLVSAAPVVAGGLSPACTAINEQAIKMAADQQLLAAEVKLSEFAHNLKADSVDGKICLGVTLGNLSAVFQRLGKIDSAEQAATRAASILEETGSVDEGVLRTSLQLLAQIAVKRDSFRKADALLNRLERLPQPRHIDVAVSEGLRGALFVSAGQLTQAEEAYRKSMAERELAGFGSTVGIIPELDNLAILYLNQERTSEALDLLRRAASIADVPNTDSDLRVETLGLFGVALGRHHDADEADLCFRRAINLLQEVPVGSRAELGRNIYVNYVAYLRAAGRKKEGKAVLQTASALFGIDPSVLTVSVDSLLAKNH